MSSDGDLRGRPKFRHAEGVTTLFDATLIVAVIRSTT